MKSSLRRAFLCFSHIFPHIFLEVGAGQMANIPSITFEMETSLGLGQSSTGPLLSHCKHLILKFCTWGLAGMSRTWRSPCKTLHNRNTCTTMLSLLYSKVRFTSAFSQGQFFLFLINWPATQFLFYSFFSIANTMAPVNLLPVHKRRPVRVHSTRCGQVRIGIGTPVLMGGL